MPGPKRLLFCAGAPVTAIYPIGPVVNGAALVINMQGYGDRVLIGINACADSVPDSKAILRWVNHELTQLERAAG